MKKKQKPVPSRSENNLEKQALSQLNAGHYKEAIGLYKKCLQTSDNDEWIQQIAYCYLQRALTFAARGMMKEALVLWENYSQYASPPYEAYDHYISWLIQAKNHAKTEECLGQLSAQQLEKQYPDLAVLLGLLMLTEHPEFQQYLPQDSALIAHYKIVQTVLLAYQQNNLEKVKEGIKQIPYRSAYRDLRTLLNAAIAAPTSIEQTQALLAKIPANSPYSQTAKLILACTREGSELVKDLFQFNHKQCRMIAEVKGLNKKQLEFIGQLTRQKDRLSDKIQFNLAIQYQSLCGSELAEHFCQAMLASYPAGRREFNKNFGKLNEFEDNRLRALICERDNESYEAEYYWKQCIKILSNEGTDNDLKIALIFRHIAVKQPEGEEQVQLLIESLEYDPADLDSYLQILSYFSLQQETVKDYKQWLTKTIEKFPQNTDVLTLAIQTATRNKAYKKASQYALKILKIDPLNTFAKQALFSSHLAHARRLMQGKKFQLVENEIQRAEELNLGKSHTVQTQLMRGLFCFADQDKKKGLQLITESLNTLHSDPMNAYFHGAMEAQLTGLPVATILRELPPAKNHLLSKQELTRIIQQLKQYAQENDNQELVHKALEKIKSAIKTSLLQQDYDEELLITLSETLDRVNAFELLRHCAKVAGGRWINPIWMYYQVYSENNGMPEKCSHMNIIRLESTREQAMEDKDYRAATLIDAFLDRYYLLHPERNMGFLDDLFGSGNYDDEDEFEDPMDQLFGHIPKKVLVKLDKRLESLFKKTSPEMLVKQLKKVIGDDDKIMSAMMQNPDLFSALMMLRAADELNIDIDVTMGDVLDCFGIDKQTDLFSF